MTEPVQFAAPEAAPTPAPVPSSPAPLVTPKRARGGGLTNVVFALAALVAVGGVTFAVGRATAPAAAATGLRNGALDGTGNGFPAGGPGGSFDPANAPVGFANRTTTLTGTVTSIDGTTLVVTTADGTETTIDTSGSTYHRQATATSSEVTVGSSVAVSVQGLGRGGFPNANASAAPGASGAPAGSQSITATDVTITGGE